MLINRYQIFQSHQTAQLREHDFFPESDGFFYSPENETDFIILIISIYRTQPSVITNMNRYFPETKIIKE